MSEFLRITGVLEKNAYGGRQTNCREARWDNKREELRKS